MKKILYFVFLSCVVSACSHNTVDMTYDCNPSGAMIFEEGSRKLGACPVTVQYVPNQAQLQEGKFYTKKITAIWPNGASTSVAPLAVDIPSNHKVFYTLNSTQGMPMQTSSPAPETGDRFASDPMAAPAYQQPVNLQPVSQLPSQPQPGQPMNGWENPSVSPPQTTGLVMIPAKHQDQDSFDSMNKDITCKIDNYIDSVYSGCPQQDVQRPYR